MSVKKRQGSKQDNRIPKTFLLAWGYTINTKILERETWEMCRMRLKFAEGRLKCGPIAGIDNVEKKQGSKQDKRIPRISLLAWG